MFEFHKDRKRYFDMQILNAEKYVLPFIEQKFAIHTGMRVLEIGCGEGGVLKAFVNKGCVGVGVEMEEIRLVNARLWLAADLVAGKITFFSKDIYDTTVEELGGAFNIIVLKDVIEHIHDQKKLMAYMQTLLTKNGVIFFGFPPWQMPYGGHQQVCQGKWMSKIPYYHLLPMPIYKWILKVNGEDVNGLAEVKETGISIERFERISKQTGFNILCKIHYLINPIYEYKFGMKPRKQFGLIKAIPWVRNFFTSCVYYLIQKK
jgi:SAM-dependent methyltransferase